MPDHCRQRPRSCRSVRLARTRTANLVVHRPIHRFVPTPTTVLRAKAIASTAPARPPSDQRRGQFPIALAAPSVPYPPQFRALALFGRRPPERVVGIVGNWPALAPPIWSCTVRSIGLCQHLPPSSEPKRSRRPLPPDLLQTNAAANSP